MRMGMEIDEAPSTIVKRESSMMQRK